ncbi:2-hydroxy-3-keto-5-methylthiopentenyl-1-phosphate phosphatase [Pelotomaculum schinkii]|uniref:2-hydroxy-3-keto-5-methylthiopentenyl-1-phosphate phosphatase n=1 Tax=Pelotomaculum schinkii TaxID=78350 RepID=A0A4Y7R8E1_9FIRM|nr:MtnX-like HAD-IB family phosphatase [Pelotomaculum schinkii]TEB05234.1 2-hydroxy-3-keto-5-methylthiopentenyl-1-phosphate phosphatase [Pelotomaculum schinkii]
MKKTIFVDFDGTITKVDTCAAMVEAFAEEGWQEINEKWERKELSTQECANRTFQLFRAGIDDIAGLMEKMEIDNFFKQFLSICREKGYKVYVLSDGYDFCIEAVFEKYDIQVPYYANKMLYDRGFKIECPHFNESCGNCGTCKTKLMTALKEEGQAVYIGDGYSDTCPAMHADVVFAKGDLYIYCLKKGIKTIRYETFADILAYIA